MPIVSIRVAPEFLRDYLEAEPCEPDPCPMAKFWENVEYPAHVEYFPEGDPSKAKAFEIDAGISIVGGGSRNQKKKSVAISMRKKYQDGRLIYPLFSVRPEKKIFKSFILHNNGNRYSNDYVEDAAGTSLLEGILDYQRSRHVIVFFNDKYNGIYNLKEKLNEHYFETNYGMDSKEINLIEHIDMDITATSGSDNSYRELLEYAGNNNFNGSDNKAYSEIIKKMDIGNYADYMLAQIYFRNGDWPRNNVKAWSSKKSPWRFLLFDIDHAMDYSLGHEEFFSMTMFDWIRLGGMVACKNNPSPYCFHNLFVKLIANDDFRRLFINHAVIIFQSYINAATMNIQIDRKLQQIPQSEMDRDLQEFPRSPSIFNTCGIDFDYNSSCTKKWVEKRDSSVREEFRKEFNLGDDARVQIIANGNGHVLVDQMALPTKDFTGNFFANNELALQAVPDAQASFAGWSDGSRENPRKVKAIPNSTYKAIFKNQI